jgi:hypothetical protein
MNKQQLIEQYLAEPIKVGDNIHVKGLSTRNPKMEHMVKVIKIVDDEVYFKYDTGRELIKRKTNEVRKSTRHIGPNPFHNEVRMQGQNIQIWMLLNRMGYDFDKNNRVVPKENNNVRIDGIEVPEICFDPIVIDAEGKEKPYQRGLVWSTEQKQLLVESIYNNIEIGKFVVRLRSYEYVRTRIKNNQIKYTAYSDLVDGKQRVHALIEFFNNEFPDLYGNYFNELSGLAQHRFKSYGKLTFLELSEDTTDDETIKTFLAINFTGIPQSLDHINYVKSILNSYSLERQS